MPGKKGATKADAKSDSQPESQEEKPVEVEEEPKAVEDTKAPEAAAQKRGRGRPKKDGSETTVKKPKKEKVRSEPSRVSRRVANMKTGATEPEPVEQQKKKTKVTKKAQQTEQEEKKDLSASNGATEQAVAS